MTGVLACGSDDNYDLPPGGIDSGPRPDGSGSGSGDGDGGPTDAGTDGPRDGTKPVITIIGPMPGTLLAGELELEVEVEDDTGISNVTATIGGQYAIPMALVSGKRYAGRYDTDSSALRGLVAPTIVVRAVDLGGDMAELGFSIVLDNEPPLGAFDPANIRLTRLAGGVQECSVAVDPVGNDAPNDGESVPQLVELRARVLDLSNTGTLSTTLFIPHAGTTKVEMFVFADETKPLVVDTGTDGVCDAINPQIVPATVPMLPSEAAVIELVEIPRGGAGFFPESVVFGGSNATQCGKGQDTAPPPPLCAGESVSAAIGVPYLQRGQVYGIPPSSSGNCLGFAIDNRATNIADGWTCVAVLVEDGLGNRSVSAPLRICIDSNGDGAEGCGPYGSINPPGERPNCTGTYVPATGMVNNTACTPRQFARSSTPNELELIPLSP
ncbi:MAG: Ig-like domain-containing protein [Kofleriaceae bacterium]